jgi:hypothetical protein
MSILILFASNQPSRFFIIIIFLNCGGISLQRKHVGEIEKPAAEWTICLLFFHSFVTIQWILFGERFLRSPFNE